MVFIWESDHVLLRILQDQIFLRARNLQDKEVPFKILARLGQALQDLARTWQESCIILQDFTGHPARILKETHFNSARAV